MARGWAKAAAGMSQTERPCTFLVGCCVEIRGRAHGLPQCVVGQK